MAALLKAQLGMNIGLSANIKISYDNAGIKTPLSAGLGILDRPYPLRYFIQYGLTFSEAVDVSISYCNPPFM